MVKLTVVHDDFEPGSTAATMVRNGWPDVPVQPEDAARNRRAARVAPPRPAGAGAEGATGTRRLPSRPWPTPLLTDRMPEVAVSPGDVLVAEGGHGGALWILVSGALDVRKGDVMVATVTEPGALIGEMSLLLGGRHSATVAAREPSRLRHLEDGAVLLDDPAVLRIVAEGLAARVHVVTAYLADLREQYDDAPGLAMVSEVLAQLATQRVEPARPGSARDPDPPY